MAWTLREGHAQVLQCFPNLRTVRALYVEGYDTLPELSHWYVRDFRRNLGVVEGCWRSGLAQCDVEVRYESYTRSREERNVFLPTGVTW
jgi:hypothetical protein